MTQGLATNGTLGLIVRCSFLQFKSSNSSLYTAKYGYHGFILLLLVLEHSNLYSNWAIWLSVNYTHLSSHGLKLR
jgi:hypothetical protein